MSWLVGTSRAVFDWGLSHIRPSVPAHFLATIEGGRQPQAPELRTQTIPRSHRARATPKRASPPRSGVFRRPPASSATQLLEVQLAAKAKGLKRFTETAQLSESSEAARVSARFFISAKSVLYREIGSHPRSLSAISTVAGTIHAGVPLKVADLCLPCIWKGVAWRHSIGSCIYHIRFLEKIHLGLRT